MLSPVFPVLIQGEIHSPEIQPQKNGVFFPIFPGMNFYIPRLSRLLFFFKNHVEWLVVNPLIHWSIGGEWSNDCWLNHGESPDLVESPWPNINLGDSECPPLFFCMYDILQLSSTWSKCMPNYTMHGAYGEIISQVLLANIQLLLYIYIPFSLVKSPFLLGKSIHLA